MINAEVQGVLPIGLEINGQRYRAFTLRAATLMDSIKAVEATGGDVNNLCLRYAIMAQRITFEGFSEPVTPDMLMGLFDRDGVALENASDAVEKKLDGLSSS